MTDNIIKIRDNDGSILQIEQYDVIPCTQEIARMRAIEGCPDRYVIFSPKRTKESSRGSSEEVKTENGIFMSLILRPSIFPSQASLLGALSATATALALSEHTTDRIGIGWVSDIFCEGNKIGQVNIEGKLDNYTTYEYIIIHFSIRMSDQYFPPRLTDMVKQIFESDNSSISMIVAKNILNKFFRYYSNIKSPAKYMDAYSKKFIQRGLKVKYTKDQSKKTCKILGIDEKNGALVLEDSSGNVFTATSPAYVQTPKKVRLKKK